MADAAMTMTSAVLGARRWPLVGHRDPADAGRLASAEVDPGDHRLGFQLDPAGAQRLAQRDERGRAGHHRAAEAAAEPAVVAGVLAVVAADRVGRHRERERVQADGRGAVGDGGGGAHLRPGRHRVLAVSWRVLADQVGERGRVALDADEPLDLVVVRGEVVIAERPVGHVGAFDRAQGRVLLEVDVPEPGHLGVPVHGAAADDLGQLVDAAGSGRGRKGSAARCAGRPRGRARRSSAAAWPGCRWRTRCRTGPGPPGW